MFCWPTCIMYSYESFFFFVILHVSSSSHGDRQCVANLSDGEPCLAGMMPSYLSTAQASDSSCDNRTLWSKYLSWLSRTVLHPFCHYCVPVCLGSFVNAASRTRRDDGDLPTLISPLISPAGETSSSTELGWFRTIGLSSTALIVVFFQVTIYCGESQAGLCLVCPDLWI